VDGPFYPGVQALARALPASAVVDFGKGCHTGAGYARKAPAMARSAPSSRGPRSPRSSASQDMNPA
jgi:hypothetical protein